MNPSEIIQLWKRSKSPWGAAVIGALIAIHLATFRVAAEETVSFLIGGYADGIYLSELDLSTGSMKIPRRVAEVHAPAFLALHPKLPIIYSVTETSRSDSKHPPMITSFEWNSSESQLKILNRETIDGDAPCYVSTDDEGRFAFVANYSSGSIMVYPLASDGALQAVASTVQHPEHRGPNKQRQEGPHAHSILMDPSNQWVCVADLGLDQVRVYALDRADGKLTPAEHSAFELPPGSGPRHLAFHPSGRWAYVINELTSTLTTASFDPGSGEMKEVQTVTTILGPVPAGNSTAEVLVHPSGRFIYGSNRVHDSIAVFHFDEQTGKTTLVQNQPTGGKIPRNFRIDPSGRYLLAENQLSGTIRSFRIDLEDGTLTDTWHSIEIPSPACIKFLR